MCMCRLFGEEIVGRIVDVRYPRIGMFRVMVVGYVAAKGWTTNCYYYYSY